MSAVEITKGKSPFYPGQPVPLDLFVGRTEQINRIMQRGAGQVHLGKPISMFVQGDYGIGKSSIALLTQSMAERTYGLHPIYVSLGGAKELDDVALYVLQATIQSGAFVPAKAQKIGNWLSKYIGDQELFAFKLKLSALKEDAPSLKNVTELLKFLGKAVDELKETGVKGIFLVLDEINGISSNPHFSHFIKGLIDQNASSRNPVPLLLMLCGVEERRREMIRAHEPIDRVFDIITIDAMSQDEMKDFFLKAFDTVPMGVETSALDIIIHYSAGLPKVMHLLGDAAYWLDSDGQIDLSDATRAVVAAADEVGKKWVDQQVLRALRSSDYKAILRKIGQLGPSAGEFKKADVRNQLAASEKKKFDNFLQKMKKLHVLRSGEDAGVYKFNIQMVQVYIWLKSTKAL
jgi:hypothetical protein